MTSEYWKAEFHLMMLITLILSDNFHSVTPCQKTSQLKPVYETMQQVNTLLNNNSMCTIRRNVNNLEMTLESATISEPVSLNVGNLTAYLCKPNKNIRNLTIYAEDYKASSNPSEVSNNLVQVVLPWELLNKRGNASIVFCMITAPTHCESQNITDGRFIGVSVSNKRVVNLTVPVTLTVTVRSLRENTEPKCVYLNDTGDFKEDGCSTEWKKQDKQVICSCNHLTYFAILLVSPENVSSKDNKVLTYISLIGCSLSLLFLLMTILLYFIKWHDVENHSQQVHISLVVALVLLNAHFLLNGLVVNVPGACTYLAVLLHYAVMSTFTWIAIEGFHLYLQLVRVFNIYIKRYLLKLSLVGWGLPTAVVILVFIIDKDIYLGVPFHNESGTSDTTQICYISNPVVKNVTTLGFYCVVLVFNLGMLVVVLRQLFFHRQQSQNPKQLAKNFCTVLGITCLLGISWGLVLLTFGPITIVGLYFFCIFNTLQGFFIFIWFCISKSPARQSQNSTETQSTT